MNCLTCLLIPNPITIVKMGSNSVLVHFYDEDVTVTDLSDRYFCKYRGIQTGMLGAFGDELEMKLTHINSRIVSVEIRVAGTTEVFHLDADFKRCEYPFGGGAL